MPRKLKKEKTKKEKPKKEKKKKPKKIKAKKLRKSKKKNMPKPLSYLELSYFCGQMALLLKSGISSIESVEMMEDDFSSAADKQILTDIYETMRLTGEFSIGLAAAGAFPDYVIHMSALGEETGNLDDVMDALEKHYAREEKLRQSIQSAVTYPLIMSAMIVAVIIILLVRVMPIFNQVFRQLGTEMTGFAAALMKASTFVSTYSFVLLAIVGIALVFALFCFKTEKGKVLSRRLSRHIRASRDLNDRVASCRFADGMSLVLRSGMAPDRGFDLVAELNEDIDFGKKLELARSKLNDGTNMSDALFEADIFSGVYSRLTSIGSKTGSLDEVMGQIAALYQDEIDTTIANRLAVLEPALIVILSVIVGVILLSVMFPLLGIMATL